MDETSRLLKEGIRVLKAGQRERAKTLLMQAIEADEENERAWLWLSGAVETDEERRICLENVLTLNPDHELAQKGLARLPPVPEDEVDLPPSFEGEGTSEVISEPISEASLPPSLEARAAQLAQPEPSHKSTEWWEETPVLEPPPTPKVKQFHDVWARNEELCAFCAEPIIRTQNRCPKCERPLIGKALINSVPGMYYKRLLTWLTVFISLRAIGILLVLAILFSETQLSGIDTANLLVESLVSFVPLIVAAAGIYQRQAWAYWLLLVVSFIETGLLALVAFGAGSFGVLICLSPLLVLSLFILFTIYMAGEDFQKMPVRRIAVVSDRLKKPQDLDKMAHKLAKEGKWASAVLHWQRAVGRASGHAPYLLRLGHAYAELGFYERSLDILKSALEAARNSELRQKIEQELVRVTHLSQSPDEAQPI